MSVVLHLSYCILILFKMFVYDIILFYRSAQKMYQVLDMYNVKNLTTFHIKVLCMNGNQCQHLVSIIVKYLTVNFIMILCCPILSSLLFSHFRNLEIKIGSDILELIIIPLKKWVVSWNTLVFHPSEFHCNYLGFQCMDWFQIWCLALYI